ncbi:cupin domain-containing protein [Amycolatopsis sacchari]|uniref:cupin domain-containing protein n=1 Tax=Amycolatopsis sacchari TaxID=115433 RepID=UPI000B89F440
MDRGSAWLIRTEGPPQELKPGDVVLSPSGTPHGPSHKPGPLGSVMRECTTTSKRRPA